MNKKKWLSIFLLFIIVASFTMPTVQAETEWQKLDRQIQEIEKKKKETANRKNEIQKQINNINQEQKNLSSEITMIESEISKTEKELFALEKEIATTTEAAKQASLELEQATKRVEERDELLKTRLRLMYRRGDVDYLEVLLGSSSFTDFIQRFNALQKIIDSDKKILQDNINDKNTIANKKQEIDKALTDLEDLYAQSENLKATLEAKKNDRTVRIASLSQKEEQLEEIKQEEEEEIIRLTQQETKLNEKLKQLNYDNSSLMAWPVPSSHRVTSEFGMRIDPINGNYTGHKGLDIGRAPGMDSLFGADIVAAADGIVIVAQYVNGYGNTVMIDHGSGISTLYGHIRNGGIFVKVGQEVEKGKKIAEVGSTGRSTGPHLHFEVRNNNVPVNPWNYLPK